MTALALQMLNPRLPAVLVRQWWMADPDIKSELAEELRRDDFDYETPEGAKVVTKRQQSDPNRGRG